MSTELKYKPLLYTTTVRNPERYKDFMHILRWHDGKILNEDTVERFERDLFKYGLYRPNRLPVSVQEKWRTSKKGEFADEPLTEEETMEIYRLNDPKINTDIKGHKEAGFPMGWPSRFDTQFKLMKVLGFVYYEWGRPIVFSQIGKYLAETVEIDPGDGITHDIVNPQNEQLAFMQAFAKQQRCNPFVREKNDNIPLILLLEVIKKLDSDPNYNGAGISYKEIPLVIFWRDNDSNALYERIKLLRKKYGYNPSAEVIEDICVNEILGGGFKKFKLKSIVAEYPDDFVRKMRMTGLISFRGGGRFIDINHNEDERAEYIISTYSSYRKYSTEKEYFEYMSYADEKLIALKSVEITRNRAAEMLCSLIKDYSWDLIKIELLNLANKASSSHDVLRFIPAPARLEFLTALAIKSRLPNIEVIPNYPCDDEGLPTSTAGGNNGDIECFEKQNGILVEVTMAERRQQTMMEVWPITRHLEDFVRMFNIDSQCVFIAPSLFADTQNQIAWTREKLGQIIRPYKITDFVQYLESADTLYSNDV